MSPTDSDELLTALVEQGQICALASAGQRDLQGQADAHRALFPSRPFDGAMFASIALATAFSAPWCTAEQLQIANRASLWVSAEDWSVDRVAKTREEVDALVEAHLAVADGAVPAPDDPLGRYFAEFRDRLAAAPAFAELRPVWREELRRMLTAEVREFQWRSTRASEDGAGTLPTFEEYLDNADNYGASFVNVSHWIYTGDPSTLAHIAELAEVGRAVGQMFRLVNDLASYDRDVRWGDINALMFAADRAELTRRAALHLDRCRELIRTLRDRCPREAVYLTRQIGFTSGFYRVTDFWGSL